MEIILAVISWKQYLLVLGGLLGIFYIILFMLLSKRSRNKSTGLDAKENQHLPSQAPPSQEFGNELSYDKTSYNDIYRNADSYLDEEAAFDNLEELASKIEGVLMDGEQGIDKDKLLSKMRSVVSKYPQLNKLPFRVAINNVIIKRAKQHCDIDVSDAEVDTLWRVI